MLRAYGPVVERGMWIVRCDQGMGELYKYLDRVRGIKCKSFEYIGYVVIMDHGRSFSVFGSKTVGT